MLLDSHPSLLRSAAKQFQRRYRYIRCSKYVGNNRIISIFSAPLASIYCTGPSGEIQFRWALLGWEQNTAWRGPLFLTLLIAN